MERYRVLLISFYWKRLFELLILIVELWRVTTLIACSRASWCTRIVWRWSTVCGCIGSCRRSDFIAFKCACSSSSTRSCRFSFSIRIVRCIINVVFVLMLLGVVVVSDVTGRGLGRGDELTTIGSCTCTTITKESKRTKESVIFLGGLNSGNFTIEFSGGVCLSGRKISPELIWKV